MADEGLGEGAVQAFPAGTLQELDPHPGLRGGGGDVWFPPPPGQSLLSSSLCSLSCEAESERCLLPWRGSAVPFPSGVPRGARPSSQAWALAPACPFPRALLEPGGGPSGPGRWWAARRGCPGRRADCQDRWWAGQGSGARPICSRPPVGLFLSTWG